MAAGPRKTSFRCPHCGFVQLEPEHLISTYCRSCGDHYNTRAASAARPPVVAARRGERSGTPSHLRPVKCYHCAETHEVSIHSRSTLCPGCSACIDFGDLTFTSNVSRPIDIRGKLTVEAGAFLNSPHIICGEAYIAGRIAGLLHCEGTLHLATSGRIHCRIFAADIHIGKEAAVEISSPVKTGSMEIRGQAGGVFECSAGVQILRGGGLRGKITARSISVEKGGLLIAESRIEVPEAPRPVPRNRPERQAEFDGFGELPQPAF